MIDILAQQQIRIIENFGGTAWTNQTNIHPLALVMTILCGGLVILMQRKNAVWPFLVMACFVAPAQRIILAGLDFNLIRIMVLCGFVRVLLRKENAGLRWQMLDYVILAFAISRTFINTVQLGTTNALIFQLGQNFDAIGLYFLFRCLVRSREDILRIIQAFVVISIPVLAAFFIENRTGHNLFAFFGGVPAITLVREGRLRCQGAFAHPIIAGCFWASTLPMVVALWWQGGKQKFFAVTGTFTMIGIVMLTASSTPVMGILFGLIGAALYFVRRYVLYVFYAACGMTVVLHLCMQQPVWHLISRITIAQGNTSRHRYLLIDNAINRFGEWALLGTPGTAHWFFGAQDVTNHYILEGVRGGFLTMVILIVTIGVGFNYCGRLWRSCQIDKPNMVLAWSFGVALFIHCTNFFGVAYWAQANLAWYLLLAMIASMLETRRLTTAPLVARRQSAPVRRRVVVPTPAHGVNAPAVHRIPTGR